MTLTFNDVFGPIPDVNTIIRVSVRLVTALIIGGVIGLQRELTHHPAGLRTHMLVAMGTALLVIGGQESGMSSSDVSRIVQGIVTGIGFLGGGAILKLTAEHEIRGLTTAAGIWMTAACAVAAGLGRVGVAIIGVILALFVLMVLRAFEERLGSHAYRSPESKEMRIDTQDDADA
ncbi:MAG TPA: MgtC/SapB family protein [Steroidobacteraceae bacterium]